MTDPFSTIATELPRDRWGRPLITPPGETDAIAYMRVTTFISCLEDTYGLGQWQMRMVALGMSQSKALQLAAAAIRDPKDRYQKRTLQDIADQAKELAGGSSAATTGTALHTFTEMIDRGEVPANVPEDYLADLDAYREITAGFQVVAIEGFCVNDNLRVGGSYDRIMRVPEGGLVAPDGSLITGNVIWDLKTGGSIEGGLLGMGKIAMQMGTYANSQDYDHTLGTRTPLDVNTSWGIVCHLPAGSGQAQLIWVDIAAGWEAASKIAPLVHAWRKRKDISKVFAATKPKARALTLPEQIKAATSYEQLKEIHADNRLYWTPGLTSLAAARKAELEAA